MADVRYPNFHQEVIDAIQDSDDQLHWITSFQLRIKGKRKDDLVALGLGKRGFPSDISLYENPLNIDFDEGIDDDSVLTHWNRLTLQKLKYPSSCIAVDITGNGFNDLVVTCEYGESPGAIDPYGGRICWLENFATNEGDWSCHEIGRFPGVNCIKVGHFTTTYSLQLLAVVRSPRAGAFSPLVIFTRPPDVYKSKHWLVATALENVFSSIQDCLVIPGSGGALDRILISSREGFSVAWYHRRSWQCKSLDSVDIPFGYSPGRLCAGRIGRDPVAFFVSAEADGAGRLSLFSKHIFATQRYEPRDIPWRHSIIDDFRGESGVSILGILCEDFDGDGVDEIIVSLSCRGPNAGVYYYDLQHGSFVKYKLHDKPTTKLSCGHFSVRNRLDLALVTRSNPSKALVLYHSHVSSQIIPSIDGSELLLSVPRLASSVSEFDIIDIAGYTISLVVLPANASYDIVPDGSEAVKILNGLLGWVDSQSEIIERTRVACSPDCVTPILVDSPEGRVRSGNEGAVFVRMRPSQMTDAVTLKALNVSPSYFPCDVRYHEFSWRSVKRDGSNESKDGNLSDDLYHLSGFQVRFRSDSLAKLGTTEDTMVSSVHFWAARPGTSTSFLKDVHSLSILCSSWDRLQTSLGKASLCSFRTCLSNPSGEGGLVYCQDPLDWTTTPPNSHQIARARKLVVPVMYEHGPFWRTSKTTDSNGRKTLQVEHPWHSWTAGRANRKQMGQVKWGIWAAFDFPAFEVPHLPESEGGGCIIS